MFNQTVCDKIMYTQNLSQYITFEDMIMVTNNIPPPENELIQRAKSGDEAAFTALVEAYSKRIFNIGLRMLGSREDAADMTQDALLKIYRYLDSFRGDAAFSTWVYRISVNCCRDYLRIAYRSRELPFSDFAEDDDNGSAFEVADRSAIPEDVYLSGEGRDYLIALISQLAPKYRIIVVLREICGLSYQEIADTVDISIGTVKSRLSRARMALVQKITADREQYSHLGSLIECNEDERRRSDELC